MSFSRRLGNFFFVIGLFLIFFFLYTDTTHSPAFRFLIFGLLCVLAGMLLYATSPAPPPPPPSQRFRVLRSSKKQEKDRPPK